MFRWIKNLFRTCNYNLDTLNCDCDEDYKYCLRKCYEPVKKLNHRLNKQKYKVNKKYFSAPESYHSFQDYCDGFEEYCSSLDLQDLYNDNDIEEDIILALDDILISQLDRITQLAKDGRLDGITVSKKKPKENQKKKSKEESKTKPKKPVSKKPTKKK